MEYRRGRPDGQPSQRRSGTFTGAVLLDPVLEAPGIVVNSVCFEPGARTHWHSHDGGQLLLISNGRGYVGTRDGGGQAVQAGDAVYAPPGEEHWHGAGPDTLMLHTSVSLGRTNWLGEVGDDRYTAAFQQAARGDGA